MHEFGAVYEGRHRLLLRFILYNAIAFALLTAAWLQGWLDNALTGYTLWLVGLVSGVFSFGFVVCAKYIYKVNEEIDDLARGNVGMRSRGAHYLATISNQSVAQRNITADLLRLKMTNEISLIRHIAGTLVFLGLIGTVVGFIVALSSIDAEMTASADKVAPMIGNLMQGMSIALYTTLVGAVLYLWLTLNQRMLSSAALDLYTAIVALGERQMSDSAPADEPVS